MTHITDAVPTETALCTCTDDPDVRILRRVSALCDFPLAGQITGVIRRVAIIDTDVIHDEIIDIAVVVIEVDEAGEIVGIASAGQALRDPGMAIPPHISGSPASPTMTCAARRSIWTGSNACSPTWMSVSRTRRPSTSLSSRT